MIIPKDPQRRDRKLLRILEQCERSKPERAALYQRRRRYFLFGSDAATENASRYNRLQSHTDLVASFLYAADHARFSVSAPPNSSTEEIKKMMAAENHWNDTFVNSGLANRFGEAVLWATVYDGMTIKLGWNDSRDELMHVLVDPFCFGVYNERETDLDSQEAFCHTYAVDLDQALLRLYRAGKSDKLKRMSTITGPKVSEWPPVLSNLVISATGGMNLTGNVIGNATPDYNIRANYEAVGDQPMVKFHELWVWDDVSEDYATFIMCEPDIIVSDSRETIEAMKASSKFGKQWANETNIFLKGEHPFVPVRPYQIYDYYWGEAHAERLIPLQDWSNERLDQIALVLQKQTDPAKVFSGFMGLSDEKAGMLGGPGSWVMDQMPGAKVEELAPQMPPDLFREFNEIGNIFLEASGLTKTITGQGGGGGDQARGGEQQKQMAQTGSSRIRKAAVNLEEPLGKIGDIGLKLCQKNDDTRLMTDSNEEMVLAQIGSDWKIRISGHSHSPLFADESKDQALLLLKTQAIDREAFIRMLNPPNADNLIHALRERTKAEAEAIRQNPELASKGKEKAHAA